MNRNQRFRRSLRPVGLLLKKLIMILNNILTYKNSTRNRSVDKARTTTLKIFYRNHSNYPPPAIPYLT